ncbi:MAG: MBL fold metallo-hydrolase [Bryobacterales bacterium]|nr:MBL fold metallo-hydrolase [Bryobacterales bacterium]
MNGSSRIRMTAVSLALSGLFLAWTQAPQAPAGNQLTIEKIADDLHVLVGSGGNVAVYTTNAGLILVDDKFERNVPEILEKVKTISDKPIRYVLNTHQHGDHTGGNAMIKDKTGAVLFAHVNARDNMVERKMPGVPGETFTDKKTIKLGGKQVQAYYFGRGHTNGDAVYVFPARKTMHMGDLFSYGGPFLDYSSKASGVEIGTTLGKALGMKVETVIPGHGPISKKEDLATYRREIETAVSRVKQQKSAGVAKDQLKVKTDDLKICCKNQLWERSMQGIWDEVAK